MAFSLPDLPYPVYALDPQIDAETMQIHHGKHHQAYVTNLNAAIEKAPELQGKTLQELLADNCAIVPDAIKTAVRNNGGGHANHSLFWPTMAPRAGGAPKGQLADAINAELGSFDEFKKQFTQAAMTRFGSGWAWLAKSPSGKLEVFSTANQDSPLMTGHSPIIGLDVWEHAYYLKYQNRRAEYVEAWWKLVNWSEAGVRYGA